ncbi:DUF2513 domain-containing protein [Pelomicrobium sp. G1]|uniref:DUF2513 domain-containing protein n=1 Tax=unclassified Pelomicrobium TaxID=2815318 RepID=UPI003F758429
MKRDWELIRMILLRIETAPDLSGRYFADRFPEWPADAVNYHLWLLIQSGLIAGQCNADAPRPGFVCYGVALTWAGQEFLAAVRDDMAWHRIKARLAERVVDLSLDAVLACARRIVADG